MSDETMRFLGCVDAIKNGIAWVTLEHTETGYEYTAKRPVDDFGGIVVEEGDGFVFEIEQDDSYSFKLPPKMTPEEEQNMRERLERVYGPA